MQIIVFYFDVLKDFLKPVSGFMIVSDMQSVV